MAAAISASVSSNSVDSALLEIDLQSRKPDGMDLPGVTVGPFGLFNAHNPLPTLGVPCHADESQPTSPKIQPPPDAWDKLPFPDHYAPSELPFGDDFVLENSATGSEPYLSWTDLFGLDFELPPESQVPGNPMTLPISGPGDTLPQNLAGIDLPAAAFHVPDPDNDLVDKADPDSVSEADPQSFDLLSPEAHLLLKTYGSVVIPHMSSLPPGIEFGWGPINHQIAIHTLAEVMFLPRSEIKLAKLANLHVVMATSAYYISTMGIEPQHTPKYWLNIANQAFHEAKGYLQRSFETEIKGPRAVKYKEQLMATQSLMAHAVSLLSDSS